ncbi:hypothetical protein Agabi119p4_6828 [Agaricus bisporus var. burnettii]|uniref:Uncharacterized protein n=1 Tax=Agaricus bisporus var. burnettii TaxID=192524 RepID=A0A8H7KEZ5_AGABI|nr:hypothetical protein Agabi119p4_6828 [Agaricus bisporus var. burnettii]
MYLPTHVEISNAAELLVPLQNNSPPSFAVSTNIPSARLVMQCSVVDISHPRHWPTGFASILIPNLLLSSH